MGIHRTAEQAIRVAGARAAFVRAALGAWLALAASPGVAHADRGAATRRAGPCAGCQSSLPAADDPRPLLVVLHGDGESAASIFAEWEPAAAARRIVVFAPSCPHASRSWWKWDGDPAWLLRQIDALAQTRAIDRERMWLAGWSGGGTYIGWNTQELERTFAALVIHGGGVRPKHAACSDPKASIYFLGGDANPLHDLAEELHDFYARCGHEVAWTVVHGADHGGERRALLSRRDAILDWLATKQRIVAAPAAPVDAGPANDPPSRARPLSSSMRDPPSPSGPLSSSIRDPAPLPPLAPPARVACACRIVGAGAAGSRTLEEAGPERERGSHPPALVLFVTMAAALLARQRAWHSRP
jgi:poly(3-hydroxybutyrate) depolymerase